LKDIEAHSKLVLPRATRRQLHRMLKFMFCVLLLLVSFLQKYQLVLVPLHTHRPTTARGCHRWFSL